MSKNITFANLLKKYLLVFPKRSGGLFFFLVFLLLTGCMTNSYRDFYTSFEQPLDKFQKATGRVRLIEIRDFAEVIKWEAKGYCVLGHSKFNGKWNTRALAVDCAEENGASIVLVFFRNTDMKYDEKTYYIPTTETTYHHGSVYTPYAGSAYFSGTSTTYGSRPLTIGYIDATWDQEAIYLAPLKKIPEFGIDFDRPVNIPGVDKGPIKVRVVYHNTPAERQGIRSGDIVKKINGIQFKSRNELNQFLRTNFKIVSVEVEHAN